mgnify:CR=1 FL=1
MKKAETIEKKIARIASELEERHMCWDYIREHGCQDPFYADGVNMNLVRNHIIFYRRQLLEMTPGNLPDIYYRPVPPEVPQGYMCTDGKYYQERRQRIWGVSFDTEVEIEIEVNICPTQEKNEMELF